VPQLEQEAQLTGLTLWEYLEDEHAEEFPYSTKKKVYLGDFYRDTGEFACDSFRL
jgi:hypothetical protein